MNLVNRGGFIAMGVSIAAMIGSSLACPLCSCGCCHCSHLSAWWAHPHQGGLVHGGHGWWTVHCCRVRPK